MVVSHMPPKIHPGFIFAIAGWVACALCPLEATSRGQHNTVQRATISVELEQGGEKYLLVRDANTPERCYYIGSKVHLANVGKVPDVRLIRYDYRKSANGKESLAGAILNFTASWELPPDVVGRLKPVAAKLTGVAENKLQLHPLPLASLKVSLVCPGVKEVGLATPRAVHAVGLTGVTATMQMEVFESELVEALLTGKVSGLLIVIKGKCVSFGHDSKIDSRSVELRGEFGFGQFSENVRKSVVVNLPDWVSAACLVPPAVGPDSGIERVTIDIALGTKDSELKALTKSLIWTSRQGWTEGGKPAHYLAFTLASLPPDLRKVARDELRFHGTLQVVIQGEVQRRSFSQAVSHGTDFLLAGSLPVRVAEFYGAHVPWVGVTSAGSIEKVQVSVRYGVQTLKATMQPIRNNNEFEMPPPLRLAFLELDEQNENAPETEAQAVFFFKSGKSVVWDGSRNGATVLPFSVDLLLPKP